MTQLVFEAGSRRQNFVRPVNRPSSGQTQGNHHVDSGPHSISGTRPQPPLRRPDDTNCGAARCPAQLKPLNRTQETRILLAQPGLWPCSGLQMEDGMPCHCATSEGVKSARLHTPRLPAPSRWRQLLGLTIMSSPVLPIGIARLTAGPPAHLLVEVGCERGSGGGGVFSGVVGEERASSRAPRQRRRTGNKAGFREYGSKERGRFGLRK